MAKKPIAFFANEKRDGEPSPSFAFGRESYVRKALASWGQGKTEEREPTAEAKSEEPAESDFTHESALTAALSKSVDFGLAQFQLITASSVTPALFNSAIALQHVIDPIAKSASLVEEGETFALYSLTEAQYAELIKRRDFYAQMRAGMAAFPSATLLSIVSTFDTLIVDIVAKMLRLNNAWMQSSEKLVPLSQISQSDSIKKLLDDAISDELYLFSRGSHEEQARYVQRTFGVSIKDHWKRWPDYIEVFERRNLIAHGEKNFNQRYVQICTDAGHKGSQKLLGKEIELRTKYLGQSLDILVEFAVLLSFSLWRKSSDKQEELAFQNLNEAAFKLISNGRFLVSSRILEYALSLQKSSVTDEIRRMMIVNLASSYQHMGKEQQANEVLADADWTATSDLFKICVAAVAKDVAKVIDELPKASKSGAINAQSIRDWPCFSFVRKDEKFRQEFKKTFKEDLAVIVTGDAGSSDAINQENNKDIPTETLH